MVLAPALLMAIGCGGRGDRPATAPVSGRVTLNGEAVTSGYVLVSPNKGKSAVGKIGADGAFVLGTYGKGDGVVVGSHPLTLMPVPPDEETTPPEAVVPPARYGSVRTSGLEIVVPAEGLSDYAIELTATKKEVRASQQRDTAIE